MINASLYGLGPLFTRQIGLPLTATSTFMACAILGGLVLQVPIGRISDRYDRRKVLTITSFVTAASCLAVIASVSIGNMFEQAAGQTSSGISLYITAAIYGSLAFTLYSLSAAQANDVTPPDKLIQTAGGLLIAYGLGAIFGPLLGGFIMEHAGPRSLFAYIMVLCILLGAYVIYRTGVRKSGKRKRVFLAKPETLYSPETLYNSVRNQTDRDSARAEVDQR